VESLAYVLTAGWASGVNVYATVLVTGLLGRFGGVEGVPEALQRTDVLVAAAVLYACEFVADKIPFVDSAWDAVHTVIRPTLGAVVGALIAGEADDLGEAVGAVLGGSTALASHSVKAGLRLAANASPEPASNVVASVAEDAAVVGVLLLAIEYPWAALAVALALLVGGAALVVIVFGRLRRAWRRLRARYEAPP
jgi:hypothetical protein